MRPETQAIVVAVRPHGEHGAIVRALTTEEGLRPGYVRGGKSRRLRPVLVPGNLVEADYRSRTEEQLAHLTVELVHSRAFLLSEPLASAGIEWATALTAARPSQPRAKPGSIATACSNSATEPARSERAMNFSRPFRYSS